MQVFVSWKHSLMLCKPAAMKNFTLLILKAMYGALQITWVALVPLVLILTYLFTSHPTSLRSDIANTVGAAITYSVIYILFVLAVRPSADPKKFAYFNKNGVRSMWVLLSFVGIYLGILVFVLPRALRGHLLGLIENIIDVCLTICVILFFLLMPTFVLLFYLDQPEKIELAYQRAFKMIWYNAPVIALYGTLFFLVLIGTFFSFSLLLSILLSPSNMVYIFASQCVRILFIQGL
jgi:hypothetical protein